MVNQNTFVLLVQNVLQKSRKLLQLSWFILKGAYTCIKVNALSYFKTEREFEDQVRILNICNTCPLRDVDRCGECGCVLKAKAALKDSSCPIGNWE